MTSAPIAAFLSFSADQIPRHRYQLLHRTRTRLPGMVKVDLDGRADSRSIRPSPGSMAQQPQRRASSPPPKDQIDTPIRLSSTRLPSVRARSTAVSLFIHGTACQTKRIAGIRARSAQCHPWRRRTERRTSGLPPLAVSESALRAGSTSLTGQRRKKVTGQSSVRSSIAAARIADLLRVCCLRGTVASISRSRRSSSYCSTTPSAVKVRSCSLSAAALGVH